MFSLSSDLNLKLFFYLVSLCLISNKTYLEPCLDLKIEITSYIWIKSFVQYESLFWNSSSNINSFWLLITNKPPYNPFSPSINFTGKVCKKDHENILSTSKLSLTQYFPFLPSNESLLQFYINYGNIFITSKIVNFADH